ncbi:MAG: hypothetical protein R6U16_09965, partial [Desulfotignum sp.]
MSVFDKTDKQLRKRYRRRPPRPETVRRGLVIMGASAVLLLMVVTGVLFPADSGKVWANDTDIRIADSKGDWGYPTPFRHYPRGPGYIRMSWAFDTLVWKDQTGFVPALAGNWAYDPEKLAFTFHLDPAAV